MKILIIEDASAFARSLKMILEDKGYIVRSASDASRATGYIRSEEFDVLICDFNMRVTGLDDDQQERTVNGLATGWIWLKEIAWKEFPIYKERVLICSAYEKEFEEALPEEYKLIQELNIKFIPRKIETILSHVINLEKKLYP